MFHRSWAKMTNKLMKNKYTPAVHPAMPDLTQGESASILRSLQPRRVAASTSAVNTESRTHSQEIQIKQTCGGKTEILSFYAYLTVVGKSWLARHYCNLELISGSILEIIHPSPHHASSRIVTTECSSAFPHPKNSFL